MERQPTQCEMFIRKAGIFTPEGRGGFDEALAVSERTIRLNKEDSDGERINRESWNRIMKHVYSPGYYGMGKEYGRVVRRTMRYIDGKMSKIDELKRTLTEMRPEGEVDIFAGRQIGLRGMLGK